MPTTNLLPLILGLVLFSFLITGLLVVPFINLLYKLHLTRRKEAPKNGKVPLFDKFHDIKAGTPVGGGVLIILCVSILFAVIFPLIGKMGVYIKTAFNLKIELLIIFFTFLSFGLLGLSDDITKMFGKPNKGVVGLWFGLRRRQKFIFQCICALIISSSIYFLLGIHMVHLPFFDNVIDLGIFYIPLSAFVIVSFSNAFNITDGLDGLASGLLLIFLIAFGIIAAGNLDTPLSLFIALWIGSLIAFLYFNIWPARIFLGDAGALSFGAMIAVIGLLTGSPTALVIIGGIFVIEVASSAIQILGWKFLKKPIMPLAPLHNTFLTLGWEEPKIVIRAWLLGIVLAVFGLWLSMI